MSFGIKSFVSEKQLEEKRKVRQEEWDRVRKPEDPVQAPEEEYDSRSLYERLKEQTDKKQEEFEEQLKFKNQFRGINQEESEFLNDVSKRSCEVERQKRAEEKRELEDFRSALAQTRELPDVGINLPDKKDEVIAPKKQHVSKKSFQQSILKIAVKRKANPSGVEPGKVEKENSATSEKVHKTSSLQGTIIYPFATKCIGILPGLAEYDGDDSGDDSADDSSSDDDCAMISNNLLSSVVHGGNEQ